MKHPKWCWKRRVGSLSARRPAGWRRLAAKQRNANPNGSSVCLFGFKMSSQICFSEPNASVWSFIMRGFILLIPARRSSREMTNAALLEWRGTTAGRKSNRKLKKPLIIQEGTSHCRDTGAAGSVAAITGLIGIWAHQVDGKGKLLLAEMTNTWKN